MVRAVAEELDRELRGARLRAVRLDGRTRDALLLFRDRTLVWRLHPDRAYPLFEEALDPDPGDLRLRSRVRAVRSPADERLVAIELAPERSGSGPFEIIVELLGNRLNLFVLEGPERTVRHALRTAGGQRPVRVGHPYLPPPLTDRLGLDGVCSTEVWRQEVEEVPPPERPAMLSRRFAWVSPLVVDELLSHEDAGLGLWREVASGARPVTPVVRHTERGPQPYPYRLDADDRPAESMMAAIRAAADASAGGPAPAVLGIGPHLLAALEEEVRRAERKVVRLTAELDGLVSPEELRGVGDLILARYGEIPAGADSVSVTDFSGATRTISLDPKLAPHENADRYYARAARSERASRHLPDRIEAACGRRDELVRVLEEAAAGRMDAEAVRAFLPSRAAPKRGKGGPPPALPYRPFRSSGGLEIRVGRGAKHNDDLTFRHSAPNDIWLHARHTAGAHVILRWQGDGNPPGRDLREAAALAAVHSKARTSGQAPVDWTRRKYVRKPRGSAPGSVVADRVQTVFVEPDEDLVERLGDESG